MAASDETKRLPDPERLDTRRSPAGDGPADTKHKPDTERLRQRLADDLAAGKTISLSDADVADPAVRSRLPELLESLRARQQTPAPARLVVPGYTLLGEIGHGGMSTVHLARQDTLGRHIALKIAPKWLGGDAEAQQRLLQEAKAMARVSHPNIVAIHDIVEIDDTVAIAMEWIDGLTLAGLLRCLEGPPRDGDMAVVTAALGTKPEAAAKLEHTAVRFFVRMLHDVARAVHRVHQAGLLHLDIKPSNVLIRRDGTPLLADFGVVREIDLAATHTRTFAGTPLYAAPEQIRRLDKQLGAHTDVYALGMTLYEALSRTQPLHKLDLARILTTVESGRVPRLDSRTAVAEDLVNVVHKAIAPERHHRYATAAEFADDLAAFLAHRPVSARPLTRTQRLQRWIRVEPWKASLTLSLLVLLPLLVGLGGYLVAQLPRIAQSRIEEQRRQAAQLRLEGYLDQLYCLRDAEASLQQLRLAHQLDPRPTSLVYLLSLALERAPARAASLLAEYAEPLAEEPALLPLVAKVRSGRPFFDDAEVEALDQQADSLSRIVLAVDRFWYANDRATEAAVAAAASALEQAGFQQDPLLQGMRVLVHGWAQERSDIVAVERAMAVSLGDATATHVWPAVAWFEIGPEEGLPRLARLDGTGRLPAHQRALPLELLLSVGPDYTSTQRKRTIERTQQLRTLGEQLLATGKVDPEIVWRHALTLLRSEATSDYTQLLATHGRSLTAVQRQRLDALARLLQATAASKEVSDSAAAAAAAAAAADAAASAIAQFGTSVDAMQLLLREVLHREGRLPRKLQDIEAGKAAAPERECLLAVLEKAWEQWTKAHPHRRGFYNERLAALYVNGLFEPALEIVPHCQFPRSARARNPQALAAMQVTAHDWQGLVDNSRLWLHNAAEGFPRREAAFYLGLGLARLGHREKAAELLAIALTQRPPEGRLKWYLHALIEDAWLHVAPDTPAGLRDPQLAARRIDAFHEHNRTMSIPAEGRWTELVRAEVLFANGDAKGAIELLRVPKITENPESHQPADLSTLRSDAALRYRGL